MTLIKPAHVLDREADWETLTGFLLHPDPSLRIGVVSGRRRVGKSYLLRALAGSCEGLYLTAVAEEDAPASRQRFATAITRYAGLRNFRAADPSWEELLLAALEVVTDRRGPQGLLVIDELPYLLAHSPELPGLLQLLYDQSQVGEGPDGGRVILCGSAISVMESLLSGTKALRGRAAVDLRMSPFDLRTFATYWGIAESEVALRLHSVLGGAPGYRNLSPGPSPQTLEAFDSWVPETVLNSGQALFSRTETEYLLREDPKFSGQVLHYSILGAVARGANTPTKIGGMIERDRTAITRPLEALGSAGYLNMEADLLWQRKPLISLADPIIRFHNLITVPQNDLVDIGEVHEAWRGAQSTYTSMILGTHFEDICRDWTRRYAMTEALSGRRPGRIGSTVVNDRSGRAKHEIDVLGVDPAHRPGDGAADIRIIGEAKATAGRRGTGDLERLEALRSALVEQGHNAAEAVLAIFSMRGFYPNLIESVSQRRDVLLVDLPTLLGHTPPTVSP